MGNVEKEGEVHCSNFRLSSLVLIQIPASLEIKNEHYLIFQLSIGIRHGFCLVSTSNVLGCARERRRTRQRRLQR